MTLTDLEKIVERIILENDLRVVKTANTHRNLGKRARLILAEQLLSKLEPPLSHRHKKRGTSYRVIGEARAQCSTRPIADGEMLVLYCGEDGVYSVRPRDEFEDGRFERI